LIIVEVSRLQQYILLGLNNSHRIITFVAFEKRRFLKGCTFFWLTSGLVFAINADVSFTAAFATNLLCLKALTKNITILSLLNFHSVVCSLICITLALYDRSFFICSDVHNAHNRLVYRGKCLVLNWILLENRLLQLVLRLNHRLILTPAHTVLCLVILAFAFALNSFFVFHSKSRLSCA